MASITIKTKEQFEDILNGATIFASGGGGPRSIGQGVIKEILSKGESVELIDATDISDTAIGAVAAGVGSPDAVSGTGIFDAAQNAWKELAKRLNKNLDFVSPGEVGAGNTFIPLIIAARQNIPVIDGSDGTRQRPRFHPHH